MNPVKLIIKVVAFFLIISLAYVMLLRGWSKKSATSVMTDLSGVNITNRAIVNMDPTDLNYNASLSLAYEALEKESKSLSIDKQERVNNLIKKYKDYDKDVHKLMDYFPEIDLPDDIHISQLKLRCGAAKKAIEEYSKKLAALGVNFQNAINEFQKCEEHGIDNKKELMNNYNELKVLLVRQKENIGKSEGFF